MKKIILCLIFIHSPHILGHEALLQFEQANEHYRNGEYKDAINLYEQIYSHHLVNAALCYNLGNAYFKLKNIPAAILWYERAKRLSPRDEDILYNLRLVNLYVVDKIEPIPQLFYMDWWEKFSTQYSSDNWAVIAIIMLWLTASTAAIFIVSRSFTIQRISIMLTILTFFICIVAFIGMVQQIQREQDNSSAIIFSPSVSIKSAPDDESLDLFILHEGSKVKIIDSVGEWRKIRIADGKVGWLRIDHVQII